MSMVVKNNMSAVSTLNTLNRNSSALTDSLKKVSSGMKINGAADDASAYAISERLRVQIRGLDQDVRNCQNGQSMLKVAEGAVSNTVEILKTLKEKAINAANDTNTDDDRATIQKELDKAIDQVTDNSLVTFNGKTLLDGSSDVPSATPEEHIIKALNTEWIQNTLDLIKQSFGTDFLSTDSSAKDIYLQFYNQADGALAKAGGYGPSGQKANEMVLLINMNYFESLDTKDPSNVNGDVANGTLDRTISHELTHAIMSSQIAGFKNLSGTLKEGIAEIVHGIDDQRELDPSHVDGTSINASGTGIESLYTDGYMALRYMARQSGNDQQCLKQFMNSLVKGGAAALDDAVRLASHGRFSSWTNLGEKFQADYNTYGGDGKKFLAEKCGIINDNFSARDNPANDTGAISGSDAGGSRIIKDHDTVVPEGGSTRFWYSPTSSFSTFEGLRVHWDSEGMSAGLKASLKGDYSSLYEVPYAGKVGNMTLQVGTKADQAIKFGFLNMTAEGLGLQDTKGNKVSVQTRDHAQAAISLFDNSIRKALAQQTNIGALQSRLEYTATNLITAGENTQSSESTIRDADMAKEMTAYTKHKVLLQASQSMLSQANQNSSNVLGLLQ